MDEFEGQDACDSNGWMSVDVDTPVLSKPSTPGVVVQPNNCPGTLITRLRPWTQYAIFVRAFVLTTLDEGRGNHGAKSRIIYVRTNQSGGHCFLYADGIFFFKHFLVLISSLHFWIISIFF